MPDNDLEVKSLITRLEQAPEGSRELDCEIHNALYDTRLFVSGSEVKNTNGIGEVWDADCPHYTTSLDAKLPGENIRHVESPLGTRRWEAWQCDGEGEIEAFGYGNTEALARRIASLKARA